MNRYRNLFPPALLLLLSTAAPGLSSATRTLSLEERIAAQERIERVYYSHQVGANRPFELAVPRPLLERKVRDALKRSVALEVYWRSPITGEMLDREMARMESGSRMPERLRELYAALGNDRTLIREMLARPALTDRLIRSFFASDHGIQASAVEEAEELRARLVSGTVDPEAESPERRLLEESHERADGYPGRGDLPLADRAESSSEAASGWPVGVPGKPREVGPLLEDRDACFMSVLLDATPGKRRAAQYRVAKRSFEAWWEEVRDGLDESSVAASLPFDSTSAEITPATSSSGCLFNDSWNNQSLGDPPLPRSNHAAVWTGSLMLVWGGKGDRDPFLFNTGGRYDPATDTWSSMSTLGAPSPRHSHAAVWTGNRLVVWGGRDLASNYMATGGQYDPATNTWSATSEVSAPAAGAGYVGAWAGGKMVIWNSMNNAGARYDPSTDVWESMAASPLNRREQVSIVSTGNSVIIWGGNLILGFGSLGARYDPVINSWSLASEVNAPSSRYGHTAIWTGTEMIVWGGNSGGNNGGRYNPDTNSWASVSSANAPSLNGHSAVWVGGKMVAWHETGYPFSPPLIGGLYDPSTNSWTPLSTTNAPEGRAEFSALAAGSQMIVWGGVYTGPVAGFPFYFATGNRYDPATDTWTPTSSQPRPDARANHAAVWTGNLMIVWGGWDNGGTSLASGGRYDPATDTWTPTTLSGAPQGRLLPSAIWTGDRMVVWGGVLYQCCPISSFTPLNSGGRYDPIADSWTATTPTGAPTPRYLQTTVWTGSRMVVWGGYDQSAALASGGRYDPATNTWDAMSASGAPAARYNHGAVMAAGSMVLWGGENGTTQFGDGGRYDPAGNAWLPLSVSGAPPARSSHSAISTDSSMVVWGGWDRTTRMNTGGRYDPLTDQWSSMSSTAAPTGRTGQSTVWTGTEMIVWGGSSGSSGLDSGGRYDPVSDSWSPMASIGSPRRRAAATGVWTGESILIWGGYDKVNILGGGSFDEELATGGQYCLCPMSAVFRDADADGLGDSGQTIQACAPPPGYVVAGGDCNDADGANWATPGEARNLQFTNATSLSWSPPSAPGSSAPHYDVIRSGSAADFVSAALCTATDTPLLSLGDSGVPAVSARFHYLIRARNGCPANAFGPLGNASNGTPRTALTCP